MFRENFLCLLLLCIAVQAGAQTTTLPLNDLNNSEVSKPAEPVPPSMAPAEEKPVERIEVTGSHIKRIDTEGPSPVETITRKQLDDSGFNSVADVLRNSTASSFGGAREDSGSSVAGNAEVDLRGLGSEHTLVLLDGQRLPPDAITGAVDLNLIPMAAVERVEILKDGASAIYGSDALGGVVNIITRKDFSGSEISLAQSTPQKKGGQRDDVSLVNGINYQIGNTINVFQYRNNQTVYSRDRDWTAQGMSTTSNYPNYRDSGGQWHADPNCPANMIKHTPQGDFCQFPYANYSTQLPSLEQYSGLSQTNIELNSRVKMTARLGGTHKVTKWSYAPSPGSFTIPGGTADHLGPGGTALPGTTPGADLPITYRLVGLGNRDNLIVNNSYNFLLGSTIDLGGDWEMDITGSQNKVNSKITGINGYALTKSITDAITTGPCNPFDPTKPCTQGKYQPEETTTSVLSSADMKISGELAHFSTGSLGLAVGSSVMYQSYNDNYDDHSLAGDVFGNQASQGAGGRSSQAVYTELSVPLTKKTELQLAGRLDHYSDFGTTINPKAAIVYHASKSVLLRASAGTGFKAPLLQELYAGQSGGYPTFIDWVSCDRERKAGGATPSCTPQQYPVTSKGNPNLKEERSVSYNAGVVYEPSRDFNIGTDLFYTKLRNVVGINYDDLTQAEAAGVDLSQYGIVDHRDSTGYIDQDQGIFAPSQNLATRELTGIDVNTSYRIHQVKLAMDHSQLFTYKEAGFPGIAARTRLGENGNPPWRNTLTASYFANERHEISLSAVTIAGQEKYVPEQGRLPNYTEYELQYTYKKKGFGELAAGIRNLFASRPPLDDSNPNGELNTSLYDQIGRQLYTSYSARF